ncbi:hypothetical protein PVAND_011151 [Polypedilum vanderplanki]|uniref:INTS8 TPR repeats domain-containing protein n=1 Tax=Polypedilum vanderplanki TaxID=319348 RepID=A0A9J6CJJ4_POLVA|nr:hypothetical protein PVAND_011151 [Polypedilum vanderplanki]
MIEIDAIKSAPLCEETVLWFEFLLKPELLDKHVNNETKAIEVVTEFLNIIPDNNQQVNEINSPDSDSLNKIESLSLKLGRKQLALKILALKVASFFNWKLDVIEKNLAIQKQVQLLSDLCSVTSGRIVNLPLSLVHEVPVSIDGNKNALSFALTLYHRWVLRAQVLKGFNTKIKPFMMIMQAQEQTTCINPDDKFISGLESFTTTSIDYLNGIISDPEPFKMLIYESFVPLDEASFNRNDSCNGQKFDKFIIISKTELKAQIHYDLCSFYIYTKKYDLAKESVLLCKSNLEKLKVECNGKLSDLRFCTINDEHLRGYLLACGISEHETQTLFQRFNECLLTNRKNLESILMEDNYKKEIPLIHRKTAETVFDFDPSSNEYLKILALNSVRYILDGKNIVTNDIPFLSLRTNAQRNLMIKYFIQFSNDAHSHLTMKELNNVREYLTDFLHRFPESETEIKESKFLIKNEFDLIKRQNQSENKIKLSGMAIQPDWIVLHDSKLQKIRLGDVQRRLIASTTAKQIRKMLVELAKFNLQQPLWTINRNWSLPNEIRVVVLNLKRGFLQDFSGCMLGKVYELIQKKDFVVAFTLLNDLRNELKRADFASDQMVQKFGKLLDWEKINVQIMMKLESAWPKKPPVIKDQLIVKINQMIRSNEMPRLEIIENVMFIMLNVNDWEGCTLFDPKRSLIIELGSAFARTMIDVQHDMKTKNQLPRKREIWDLLLPIFNTSNQQQQAPNPKRNQHNRRSSDSPARFSMGTINVSTLKQFLEKMRDPFIITLLLSMFAKMHNLLKDDTNLDLYIEHIYLWPLSISNVNGYNIKTVSESLLQLLKLGLKIYPSNVGWIRLQGDLEFVNGNNEAAMKYYVQTLVVSTEHYSLPIQRPNIDESVIKKMIKCSSNLGCYLQAAVLCQFLEDIDYTLAFKCLQEKSGNFQDAMDSYYSLIWDNTLLEYIIHLHAKKGEHKRKLQAISYIRQLELNANNSDEVKHRAAAIRKVKFLRALANQFLTYTD